MKNTGWVFVYGSLKVGGYFSRAFDRQRKFAIPASVKGTLLNLSSFPGLILGGEKEVQGELHLYKDFHKVVREMDYIEGYRKRNDLGNLYHKQVINVKMDDYKTVRALVYTLNTDRISTFGCAIVESGEWPID